MRSSTNFANHIANYNPKNKFLRFLIIVVFSILHHSTHAQFSLTIQENDEVRGNIGFTQSRLFNDIRVNIPIPTGEWTVTSIADANSSGSIIGGKDIHLTKVINKRIAETLWFRVFPHGGKNWIPSYCEGSLLSRERGSSRSGYCHSLKLEKFMTNYKSDTQAKERKIWNDAGYKWSKRAILYQGTFDEFNAFTIYLQHAITTSTIGLSDEIELTTQSKEKIEDWLKQNSTSSELNKIIDWYKAYGAAISTALEGNDSKPSAILDQPIENLWALTYSRLAASLPELELNIQTPSALAANSSTKVEDASQQAALTEQVRQQQEQRENEARERERLAQLDAERQQQAALTEQARRQQEQLDQQKQEQERLAKQEADRQQLALIEQVRELQDRLATEARERERAQKALETAIAQRSRSDIKHAAARYGLVIGNASYKNVNGLDNSVTDAKAIGKSLAALGFQVSMQFDVTQRQLLKTIREFENQLKGGDEVVFYYAGHGVQLGNTNYLLPIDVGSNSANQVRDESIDLQLVLNRISEKDVKFTLAVIDACRDNPFQGNGRAIGGRGLAPTTAATGQMIIFSAGTGQQALDKLGPQDRDPNGLFTRVFLKEMEKPGISVDLMLRHVRQEVVRLAQSVGHEQVPAMYDQTIGSYYLKRD